MTPPSLRSLCLAMLVCALPAVSAEPAAAPTKGPEAVAPVVPAPVPADAAAVAPAAPAAEPKIEPELPRGESPELGGELDYGAMLLRTVVVLGVVIAGIYLTLNHGLRRLMGVAAPTSSPGVVQVIDRVVLDQKRQLYVVRAAGEYLLVGGAEGSLQLISKLDTAEVERLRSAPGPKGAAAVSPLLQKLLGKRSPPPPTPGGTA